MRWLLLRGLMRETRHWGDFPKILEKKLLETDPSATVEVIDHPGFGTEHKRKSPTSISGIVDDDRKRFEPRYQEPAILVAISLGGMVAMDWVYRHPNDFKFLFLINSSARGASKITDRMQPKNWPHAFRMALMRDQSKREEQILSLTTRLSGEGLAAQAEKNFALFLERPYTTRNALRQIFGATSFEAPPKLPIPGQIIVSETDDLVRAVCSYELADRFGYPVKSNPTANHDLSLDDPEWLANAIATTSIP
jgi:pimeloyl-ACP methyl ester carboxylesterase